MPNAKKTFDLYFNGFMYAKEATFKTSSNWVCILKNQKNQKCLARCVTSHDNKIKLGKTLHNHSPVY